MATRKTVSAALRRQVFSRDRHACSKCRRTKALQVHHIVLVMDGGLDVPENLVTLCSQCHEQAPNSASEFFRWAASGLPPEMDSSKQLTRICVSLLFHREGLTQDKLTEALALVDEIYPDMWQVRQSIRNPEDRLGSEAIERFWRKYFPGEARRVQAERKLWMDTSTAPGSDQATTAGDGAKHNEGAG